MKILTVFGTRPEAIKLAPVVMALDREPAVQQTVCVTGQHRQMLDQVLRVFEITPHHDLAVMSHDQSLAHVSCAVLRGVQDVVHAVRPDWVIVQGDTTSAFAAALGAFYCKVRVAHVEAGLRTGNLMSPWPEEANRKLITQLAELHFAPTRHACDNLLREAVPAEKIVITGNTVIDALHWVNGRFASDRQLADVTAAQFNFLDPRRRMILVTGHRRENLDGGLGEVCRALAELSRRGDVQIVYPVHPNPAVQATVRAALGGLAGVHLIGPVDYVPFVWLMKTAYLIISDSGGVQEEAPALGRPVLVTRETTERPEAIASGTARLVGTDSRRIVAEASRLLDDAAAYDAMACARNPFGDGTASVRIAQMLLMDGYRPAVAIA